MDEPDVAVVTPVFDGAEYIAECVRSVIAQTHRRWIHFIVDNASTDGTAEAAEAAAGDDDRVRVLRNDRHVTMLENWNRALAPVPEGIPYVKHLNADDRIRPGCLAAMVETADRHPEVGIVSSYFQFGDRRLPRCSHSAVTIVPRHDVVRNIFLGGPDYLAQPSVLLLRRACAEHWPDLFAVGSFPPGHPGRPPLCGADKEGYLPVLEHSDLAFVPEMLTELRADDASATGFSARVAAWHPSCIDLLLRRGRDLLGEVEFNRALWRNVRKYVRSLAWRCCRRQPWHDPELVLFQRLALDHSIASLRSSGHRAQAACLVPFARLFAQADRRTVERVAPDHLPAGDDVE